MAATATGRAADPPPSQQDARPRAAGLAAPVLLAAGLGAAVAYAAFASGAAGLPEESRLQVWVAALSIAALATLLFGRQVRAAPRPAALAGLGLLGAFALWCALSATWSIAPDETWIEVNRALSYTFVAAVALLVGSSLHRPAQAAAIGFLVIALAVALYALGGKLVPWVEVPGLLDLNHAEQFARLREPLAYWNALALFCAMAVPIALRTASDAGSSPRLRLAALVAALPLLVTVVLTYSRGGIVVLVAALVVLISLSADRPRLLALAGAALAGSAPAMVLGLTLGDLTRDSVPEAARVDDGLIVLGALVAGAALAVALGRRVIRNDARLAAPGHRLRLARGAALAACVLGLVALIGGAALSEGGLAGSVERRVADVTERRFDPQDDPSRLLRANSGNRWSWWEEAVGAAWDRPLVGHGAGSFPLLHRRYRSDELEVRQPHSVPLEFLSETGVIGAGLGLGGLGLLALAAGSGALRAPEGRERGYAVALLAAASAWGLHLFVDWDWDIPGVTLPALVFLGVLAAVPPGRPAASRARGARPSTSAGTASRALALAAGTALLCAFAASALLPALSDERTNEALRLAASDRPADLREAAQAAAEAERLNPLSLRPLFAGAAAAEAAGRYARALELLVEAVERQPDNVAAWFRLGRFQALLGDAPGLYATLSKAASLDPAYPLLPFLYPYSLPNEANSATATGTPLPTLPDTTELPPSTEGLIAPPPEDPGSLEG